MPFNQTRRFLSSEGEVKAEGQRAAGSEQPSAFSDGIHEKDAGLQRGGAVSGPRGDMGVFPVLPVLPLSYRIT
jgi:hypothetical protein